MKSTSSIYTVLLLYVDDMTITGDNNAEIAQLRDELSICFEMKNLREVHSFLSLEIVKTNGLFISQRSFASSLLTQFGMRDSTPVATPMEPQLKLQKIEGEPLNDVTKYRQLVGSLLYLTITRPDIVYGIEVMSQFMESPCVGHLIVAKRIL